MGRSNIRYLVAGEENYAVQGSAFKVLGFQKAEALISFSLEIFRFNWTLAASGNVEP
jgi:hypothetical protein